MKKAPEALQFEVVEDWTKDTGPLRVFLLDPTITEIMVNGPDEIFVEKNGVLMETQAKFSDEQSLLKTAQALVICSGREVNVKNPYVDTSLPDGSRLNCVIPPVAVNGASLTIRKFSPNAINYKQLLASKCIDDKILYFLNQTVRAQQNMIVSGGTGSGKTTLLNVLSTFIPSNERIITLEDTAELQLQSKNLVRLEAKQVRIAGSTVTMQDLLKNALRMRPNRIIVGECRGAESWDMLMAMNTGHSGSMTTMHANTCFDALRRLEAMIIRSSPEVPLSMVQDDIANCINFVLQVERFADGKRRVVEITEVQGRNQQGYILSNIFKFDLVNGFHSTGNIPRYVKENMDPKIKFPPNFFDPEYTVTL